MVNPCESYMMVDLMEFPQKDQHVDFQTFIKNKVLDGKTSLYGYMASILRSATWNHLEPSSIQQKLLGDFPPTPGLGFPTNFARWARARVNRGSLVQLQTQRELMEEPSWPEHEFRGLLSQTSRSVAPTEKAIKCSSLQALKILMLIQVLLKILSIFGVVLK